MNPSDNSPVPAGSLSAVFQSSRAPAPAGRYPHARRVGPLLFLSGVGPRQRGQATVPGVELDGHGRIVRYDVES